MGFGVFFVYENLNISVLATASHASIWDKEIWNILRVTQWDWNAIGIEILAQVYMFKGSSENSRSLLSNCSHSWEIGLWQIKASTISRQSMLLTSYCAEVF